MRFSAVHCILFATLFVTSNLAGRQLRAMAQVVKASFTDAETQLTVEQIERLRQDASKVSEISEQARQAIDATYQTAIAHLRAGKEFREQAEKFKSDASTVNERLLETKQAAKTLTAEQAIPASADLAELQQVLNRMSFALSEERDNYSALQGEPTRRVQRRKQIRTRLAAISEKYSSDSNDSSPSEEDPNIYRAQSIELVARRFAFEQEQLALRSELSKYDAEDATEFLQVRTDLAAERVADYERLVESLAEKVKALRVAAANDSVRKARMEAILATPSLKSHADRNHELAETARQVERKLSEAEHDLEASRALHDNVDKDYRLMRQKIESVGLTSAIGALLRKQRAALLDPGTREDSIATRRTLLDETQYSLFDYADERDELTDLDAAVEKVVLDVRQKADLEGESLNAAARSLLGRKREYLDSLLKTSNEYFDTLVELDTSDRQIVKLTREYQGFIDERVLWIRSGRSLGQDFSIDDTDKLLVDRAAWSGFVTNLFRDARLIPAGYIAVLIGFGFAFLSAKQIRQKIREAGTRAEKSGCRSLFPTMSALSLTLVLGVALPLGCLLLGWRLSGFSDNLTRAIGSGLWCMAVFWAPIEFFRQICRPQGLGESHFAWSPRVMRLLRHRLRGYLLGMLPIVFVVSVLHALATTHGSDAVERVAFMLGTLVSLVFGVWTLSPYDLLREYHALNANGMVPKLKWLWPVVGGLVPAALCSLAFAGYYYTAHVLSWRLFATTCFLLSIVLFRAVLMRVVLLRRRGLSLENARSRVTESVPATGEPVFDNAIAGIVTSSPQADLAEQTQQSRRLVTAGLSAVAAIGLWLIWVQVLPALRMLDRYPLWNHTQVAASMHSEVPDPGLPTGSVTAAGASSETATAVPSTPSSTTVSDLAFAIILAFVTIVVARNGPGLLEMSVLQQLRVEPSVRYAITTLVSYLIVVVGVVLTCSKLGLKWSQIQWLVTALTFGLAFGLQEMFANFVAGLIILIERPIRVGDIVTVDDVSGVVSKIRIRATSITNWDRKEYVVPNKEFITGRLLNWTLSDKVNRIVINVGIAYGSDTERAKELLLSAAEDHPLILDDPKPVATFEGFGDNSLNFVLRTYLPGLDDRLEVIHQLHTAIDQAFRTEGIEIAFPQRDLHIRSTPAALGLEPATDADAADERRAA